MPRIWPQLALWPLFLWPSARKAPRRLLLEDGCMPNTQTLTLNKEFKRAYYRGRSFATPVLVVYAVKNRRRINRIGLTATKKIGKAVKRNRARRVMREAFRLMEPELADGYDFVLVARVKTSFVPMQQVLDALRRACEKLALLK